MTAEEALFWAGAAVLLAWLLRRNDGPEVPRRKAHVRPTTVYLLQSERDPGLVKVGYTSRLTKVRRSELNRKIEGDLKIRLRVTLPHAWYAEQAAHEDLRGRGWQRGARHLGTEWYRLPSEGRIEDVKTALMASARRTRKAAERRRSWPGHGAMQIWESGVNRGRVAREIRGETMSVADGSRLLRAVTPAELEEMVAVEIVRADRSR